MALPPLVFCDTSFFYACLDPRDRNHARAHALAEEAQHIFLTHGRDHRLSFCDAVTFVVVTTLLDHVPCFAFDEGFRRLGLQMIQ